MVEENKYYDSFILRLYTLLRNKTKYRDENGYCIVRGEEQNSYYIQSLKHSKKEEKASNSKLMESFINDFREHLFNDSPFKVLRKDESYYQTTDFSYEYFFEIFLEFVYNTAKPNASKRVNPNIQEFTKVIQCFAPLNPPIKELIRGIGYEDDICDNHYNEFAHVVLSLPNNNIFDPSYEYYHSDIIDEIFQLNFHGDNELLAKEGLINYFKNREKELRTVVNKDENHEIYDRVKNLISPQYWEDVALFIPNLKLKKKNPLLVQELSELSEEPIYQINLNRDAILNISQTIVTDQDLFSIINKLNESILLHKPDGIDYIAPVNLGEKFFIAVSGKNLNSELAKDIGKIFEKMIHEYNSDNVTKNIKYDEDENEEQNKEYLDKAAASFWLDVELDNSNQNKSNKKIKKI